jgi:hypothetical protein
LLLCATSTNYNVHTSALDGAGKSQTEYFDTNYKLILTKIIISDQGSNFLETMNSLGGTIDKPNFIFQGEDGLKKNYMMYDPPQLIKSVRNTLRNCNSIEYLGGKRASWEFIEQFYNSDKTKSLRIASKLTDKHLNPNNWERMRVSLAVQVLSESVAVGIST